MKPGIKPILKIPVSLETITKNLKPIGHFKALFVIHSY